MTAADIPAGLETLCNKSYKKTMFFIAVGSYAKPRSEQ